MLRRVFFGLAVPAAGVRLVARTHEEENPPAAAEPLKGVKP